MATRSAKLYQGEDKLPVVDYTDTVIWEESEFGTRAHNGEGSASTVVVRDPLGETGNFANLPSGLTFKTLPSKSLFIIEVDSSYLFRGRVGIKNYSRDGQHVERYRQVELSLHDTHWDLDHIFVHGYTRQAETDVARAQGIIASYLSGSPRPTTVLNGSNYISSSNLINLPEEEYNRTTPLAMIREIATSANKQFFVTGDTIGGGSLFYDGNDSTAYACPFSISDREDEIRASPGVGGGGTRFAPIWNVGPASTEDGSEQVDEIRYFYGSGDDQYVTVHSDIIHTQYGHASQTIYDDTAATAAVATARANAILAHRRLEDKTYNVTIGPLTDAQVVQIKHGQTINIKARAITDADDQFRLMRIGQCRYTTPVSGTWFAHLQLGRPWKMQPYAVGGPLVPGPAACVARVVEDYQRSVTGGWGTSEFGPEWVQFNAATQSGRAYTLDQTEGVMTWNINATGAIGTWPTYMTVDLPMTLPVEVRAKWRWHDSGYLAQLESGVSTDPHDVLWFRVGDYIIKVLLDYDSPSAGTTKLIVYLWDGTANTEIHSETFANNVKDLDHAWVSLRIESGAIKGKFWWDGDTEPAYDSVAPNPSPATDPTFLRVHGLNIAGGTANGDTRVEFIQFYDGLDATCPTTGGPNASEGSDTSQYALPDHDHDSVDNGDAAGGDLSGTYPNPTVSKIEGVDVSATDPTTGQVLTATSASTANWQTPATGGSLSVDDHYGNVITGVTVLTVGDGVATEINPGEAYVVNNFTSLAKWGID